MDEFTILRLKDDYLIFKDGEYLCVYDKTKKLVILKFVVGSNQFEERVSEELKHPHTIRWFSKKLYWPWLGFLIKKYPTLFLQLKEEQIYQELKAEDYFSVVNREHFAEKFLVDAKFKESNVVLYGINWVTVELAKQLLQYDYASITFINNCEYVEVEDISYHPQLQIQSKKTQLLFDDERVKVISLEEIEQLVPLEQEVYVVNAVDLSMQELMQFNDYIVKHKKVALMVNVHQKKVVVGPLVIGGESACLKCMEQTDVLKKYYGDENDSIDGVYIHLLLFFIMRTLFYIKGKNLYYLLKDAQIPINKVFSIEKEDITASIEYIYRSTDCDCH